MGDHNRSGPGEVTAGDDPAPGDHAAETRAELGRFLRSRRERLTPESVGMQTGTRRRTSGLRREEVSVLANVSPTWYTYLEQGRKIRPSPDVLNSISAALKLDHAEDRYLHALGSTSNRPLPADPHPDGQVTETVQSLVDASDGIGLPVYCITGWGQVTACNRHVREWYGTDFTRPGAEQNMVRWLFTAPDARDRVVDWSADAREITARLRFLVGTRRVDPQAHALIRELRGVSTEFRQWWEGHDVLEQVARARTFRHPARGIRTLRLLSVHPAAEPSTTIVFHITPHTPAAA